MTSIRVLFVTLFAALLWAIVAASRVESVLAGGGRMLRDPWSLATLVDCYCGFAVASVWIWSVTRSKRVAASWIVAVLLLGNLASIAWLLLRSRDVSSVRELATAER